MVASITARGHDGDAGDFGGVVGALLAVNPWRLAECAGTVTVERTTNQ
jgi:hypothetical protein